MFFLPHRHSNADDPHHTSKPREFQRPDGESSPKQRPGCLHVSRQPPSYGPTAPAAKLQPPTECQHSAKHAEPNIIERSPKPGAAKLFVERCSQCTGTAPSVATAAAASSESQPSADGTAEQYASADARQAILVSSPR